MRCDQSGHHMIPPLYRTHKLGKLTAREVFFTSTSNRLIMPLCTQDITHKQKDLHGESIIFESATRNNLEVYTAINIVLIYFSWGTVRNQLQQHQKVISKLVTPICWWVRFSGTHTACTYLSIHLLLPYLQTKISTWKNTENTSANKCLCIIVRHTHTQHDTYLRKPRSRSSSGQDVRSEPNISETIYMYLAPLK